MKREICVWALNKSISPFCQSMVYNNEIPNFVCVSMLIFVIRIISYKKVYEIYYITKF